MTACGFTPAEIDDMTLFDLRDLLAYWRDHPPVHDILKSVYRIECQPEVPMHESSGDPSGIGSLLARFPDGFVRAR
jgi:hypothetical protein